jgi:hypothetical protein
MAKTRAQSIAAAMQFKMEQAHQKKLDETELEIQLL